MGGKVFGAQTNSGIVREEIEPTLSYLSAVAKIPKEDLILLGSAGKKPRSGDIDLAIDSKEYSNKDFEKIIGRLKAAIGEEHYKYSAGFNTHAFAVPIAGDERKGRVQIDIKFNNAEFLSFSHFSAEGERSKYKGAVRTFLISSLATELYKDGEDVTVHEGKKRIVDVRWGLDVNVGLKRLFRMCPMRKDGTGRKKDLANVSPDDIAAEFPDLTFDRREKVIQNPTQIARQLFGKGVKAADLDTAEGVIALISEKHPTIAKKVFARAAKQLAEMDMTVPIELNGAAHTSNGKVTAASTDELTTAALPKIELEWRELRKAGKKGKSEIFAIAIEADGETFRFKQGAVGGKIYESTHRPGEQGRPGKSSYVSAEEACKREVERRVQLRLRNGFIEGGETAEATAAKSSVIDFSKPLPRDIRTPKPEQNISDQELRALYDSGRARITRKYDGMGLIVARHTFGWEASTLQGLAVTQFFPEQIEALNRTKFPVGTILKAEAVIFGKHDPSLEDFTAMGAFNPASDWREIRKKVDSGALAEPSFVFYDILFHEEVELSEQTYDQRVMLWNKFPVARKDAGLLLAAEFYTDVTPDNWRDKREELGFEGFVVVDGASKLGKKVISFSSSAPRPKGSYKLKPNMEEDVVVYAVRQVDGVYESLFAKQRYPDNYPGTDTPHPNAGEWFACGRIPIAGKKAVIAAVAELVEAGKLQAVSNNRDGEKIKVNNKKGVTLVVEFFDRFETNKFRHPVITNPVRFRTEGADYKAPAECVAAYLGEKPK